MIRLSIRKTRGRMFSNARQLILAFTLIVAAPLVFPSGASAQVGAVADPVESDRGMIVSAERHATAAGRAMLDAGGNAVDAAVATGFALAVTHPMAGNVGGGGFMVIRFPDGSSITIDHREEAPGGADRDMYLDADGEIDTERRQVGHLAAGVPGTVAGLLHALEEYGSLSREDVLEPAITLAREGFPLSRREAERLNRYRSDFQTFEGSTRYFTKEGGFSRGDVFVQEDLAEGLQRIADEGRNGFYTGETADLIVAEMERGGGLISHEDLRSYQPVEREPITLDYRGHRIITMGPPSSGGIALAQLFGAVEPFDVEALGFGGSATIHLMGEAMRRAYADRATFPGDPDFVDMPLQGLMDTTYIRERMRTFDSTMVTPSDSVSSGTPPSWESDETTHYSAVDETGMAVSVTTTINALYGSKVAVDGAGFFLNNEMADFTAKPGEPDMFGLIGSEANAIEPGKRPLSSMTPTIVENPDGRLLLLIGSPGGSTIITTVFQVILNMVDHGMTLPESIAAPRVHHQWQPDELRYERFGLAPDVRERLLEKGWSLSGGTTRWGRAQGITVSCEDTEIVADDAGMRAEELHLEGCRYIGVPDPRSEGTAEGPQ